MSEADKLFEELGYKKIEDKHNIDFNKLYKFNNGDKINEKIRLKIETKHWYGYSEPFLSKSKDRLKVSKHTMLKILDEAIKKEEDYINKLIDKEIMIRRNELCQRKEE